MEHLTTVYVIVLGYGKEKQAILQDYKKLDIVF
jgi:hypothetical protein